MLPVEVVGQAKAKNNGVRTAAPHGPSPDQDRGREWRSRASRMRVFRACRVPDRRLLGGSPRGLISRSHDGQNSLVAGKNAGNFAESALFCENPSRKHPLIQVFTDEFPSRQSREFFCQRREFFCRAGNEQGIRRKTDPRAPRHPTRRNISAYSIRK